MAALITETKPRQLQVTRIRQEEEESWISSEELHTDGSSDDDGGRWAGKHIHHHHLLHHIPHPLHHRHLTSSPLASSGPLASPPPPLTASEPASQDSPHLTETTRRLSELGVEGVQQLLGAPPDSPPTQDDGVEEQEDIMLWRPKRGSLKLTELATGAITLSSSSSSAGKLLTHIDATDSSTTDIAEEKCPSTKTTITSSSASTPAAGAIPKCSSMPATIAKSSVPLPSSGSVDTEASRVAAPAGAAQTVGSSATKVGDKHTATGEDAEGGVEISSATAAAQNKPVDVKNKDSAVKDMVVDAKVHTSGT